MTTASNSINTNSIETIAGTTTLTIGGVATDVSLPDTTTQALTVTGRTTSEIQTIRVGMTYATLPGQDTEQRAFQLFNSVTTPTVNNPIITGVITTVFVSNATGVPLTLDLPIGVWSVSYTVKFLTTPATGIVNISYMMTTITLDTPVTYDGVNYYPKYLGLQAIPFNLLSPANNTTIPRLSMSGNTIITTNVANTITLQIQLNFPGPNMRILGPEGAPTTFMIATRIA
jgi:hypothetical protein